MMEDYKEMVTFNIEVLNSYLGKLCREEFCMKKRSNILIFFFLCPIYSKEI
jgi:hypothetical protein